MKPIARKIRNTMALGAAALYLFGWTDFVAFMHQEFLFKLSTWLAFLFVYLTYKSSQNQMEGKN